MPRTLSVYILASLSRRLYVGVTNNLVRRLHEHREARDPDAFTARYRVTRLVYFETCPGAHAAITREKQVKSWRREKRIRLIETVNAGWLDLADDLLRPFDQVDPSSRPLRGAPSG